MFTSIKKYTSGPIGWLLLFLLVIGLAYGVFLWSEEASAPEEDDEVSNVAEDIEVVEEEGKVVVRNESVGYEFEVGESFVKQDKNTLFDSSDGYFCKLTVNTLVQDISNFDEWLKTREQVAGVTILNRDLIRMQHDSLEVYMYDVEILETGQNKILYIKRPNFIEVTQIVAFADEGDQNECYENLDEVISSIKL